MKISDVSPTQHATIRRWVRIGVGIAFLIGVMFAFWPYINASKDLHQFCAALPAGTIPADVQAQAQARGYVLLVPSAGLGRVEDPSSFGRRSCELHFGPSGLLSAN